MGTRRLTSTSPCASPAHNERPRIDVDAAVIGGGHNGLTCAAYLAEAGRSVVVLERSESVGGAARSERVFPDHDAQLSRYAYLVSLMPQLIVDELGLDVTLLQRTERRRRTSSRR